MLNVYNTFFPCSILFFFKDEEDEIEDEEQLRIKRRREQLQNIRVVKTKGGLQEEVLYTDLDRQSQKEVITDLLVKSAVHYALQKQEVSETFHKSNFFLFLLLLYGCLVLLSVFILFCLFFVDFCFSVYDSG